MSPLSDSELAKLKPLILLTINIFQPVKRNVIATKLNKYVRKSDLDNIIEEMVANKKVVEEPNGFRLTYSGQLAIVPGKGRFLRDINRMEYLVQLSKQRGGSG